MGYGLDLIHGAGSVCSNLMWKSMLWHWTARGLAVFVYLMQGLGSLADLTSCSFVYVSCIGQFDVNCHIAVDDAEY